MSAKGQAGYAVLIVDDSHDDLFLINRTLRKLPRATIVAELHDGDQAIHYLLGEEPYKDRAQFPLPDLLILDLKMPRVNGFEVLQWLQAHPIPGLVVAALSGSCLQTDYDKSMKLGAHGFWTKAFNSDHQLGILQEIESLLDRRRWPEPPTPTA